MKNVYLDFGANKGQGLRSFIKMYNMDETWTIETYEPETMCNLKTNISDLNYLNIKIYESAVWVKNGTVDFSRYIENDEGGSVNKLMSEGYCSDPNFDGYNHLGQHFGYRKHDNIIKVNCLDISDILNRFQDDDFIVVKMDIEGSEFATLRKILEDNSANKINHLYVEWHTNHVKDESEETANELKSKLIERNILLKDWH